MHFVRRISLRRKTHSFLRASFPTRQRSFRNALGERGEREIGALNSASNIIPLNAFVNNAFSSARSVRNVPSQFGSLAYISNVTVDIKIASRRNGGELLR